MKNPTTFVTIVSFLAAIGGPAAAMAQEILGAKQQVMRLNPKRDPGKPAYTVADCFRIEHCLSALTQTVSQSGGNPGLLAEAKHEPLPDVSGEDNVYRFEAPQGENFCKAVLLKLSVAPNFGDWAPEVKFLASRRVIHVSVRLRAGEGATPRAWFDGILMLLSVRDGALANNPCTLKDMAQEAACKGKCETIIF